MALPTRPELGNANISGVKPVANMVTAISSFYGPNCFVTRLKFSERDEVCQYMYKHPIDEFHVAKHLVSVRTIVIDPMFDESFDERNLFVADEDRGVIERVDPMVFPDSMTKEVFVPADAADCRLPRVHQGLGGQGLAYQQPRGGRRQGPRCLLHPESRTTHRRQLGHRCRAAGWRDQGGEGCQRLIGVRADHAAVLDPRHLDAGAGLRQCDASRPLLAVLGREQTATYHYRGEW